MRKFSCITEKYRWSEVACDAMHEHRKNDEQPEQDDDDEEEEEGRRVTEKRKIRKSHLHCVKIYYGNN